MHANFTVVKIITEELKKEHNDNKQAFLTSIFLLNKSLVQITRFLFTT